MFKKQYKYYLLGSLAVGVIIIMATKKAPIKIKNKPVNDMDLLHPIFRQAIDVLLLRMKSKGFNPRVHETVRSVERSKELTAIGTGKMGSVHRLGLGVDIVENSKTPWNPVKGFWKTLAEEAKALGLESGYYWKSKKDFPHIQALPTKYDRPLHAGKYSKSQITELVKKHVNTIYV